MSRRRFLSSTGQASLAATAGGAGLLVGARDVRAASLARVDAVPTNVTRTWLAPQYWANRLADWRLTQGRFECLTAGAGGRTIGVLTRSIAAGSAGASMEMRTGTLAGGSGFSGFLIGAGGGKLDWRAAALVMGASGEGGGFLAVYDSDGHVRFREHTDEVDQFRYAVLQATARSGPAPARSVTEDVTLRLDIAPDGRGTFDVTLAARRTATGALLSTARLVGVPDSELVGGLSLISSTHKGATGARHWMRDLRTGGDKVSLHERSAGPVLGTLFSLNGSVLKLTAQMMPVGAAEPQLVTLQTRAPGTSAWSTRQSARIGPGFTALFRIGDWDPTRDWEYRVSYAVGTPQQAEYAGRVPRDPRDKATVSVAMVNCMIHSPRNLDVPSSGRPRLPGERFRGLYTKENLYFPYAETVAGITKAAPDLLVAFGDQYYEGKPTVTVKTTVLDVLSRYYLWLLSVRSITRNTPTVCLVDDHDVYQGNLWGWSGRAAPRGNFRLGGYSMPADWVNTVQRVQCGHNPDPYDPTTVLQGITVYYTAFSYGGVSFSVLEDRKFKNTNESGLDQFGDPLPEPRELLGDRQEWFLQAWTQMHPGEPKVCLTQTVFACVQTSTDGGPVADPDSNGSPAAARTDAVTLLARARALVLSGDQHLGSLVRHGIDGFADGPVQFSAPAVGSAWQRWFQPAAALANANGPHTGDFTDGFGNRFRVLAVANPRLTAAQVLAVQPDDPKVADRSLKREGYGIVEIDKRNQVHRIHCWPWSTDPTATGATEYAGWPYVVPFADA